MILTLIDIGCRQSGSMSAQRFFIKIGFYTWIRQRFEDKYQSYHRITKRSLICFAKRSY